jgi:NAD(P)-dependent dehydrogenase (short-subunit alcohol dehydrogenase family)
VESFAQKLAVVTGGGSGIGRELVIQLAREGASIATCDIDAKSLEETANLARKGAADGVRITTHVCDVQDEAQMHRFRDEVVAQHDTDHVHLVFNNAGIGGGASFIADDRAEWDRTFGICWGGVYNGCRAFVPLLIAGDDGYLVNTSSVNGFWALLPPGMPNTAYSTAKFAVKGFSEALLADFRVNAPHVKVAVVMPGHVGTDILRNTRLVHAGGDKVDVDAIRSWMDTQGIDHSQMSDEDLASGARAMEEGFRTSAPMTAVEAAAVILNGVRGGEWRILVGDDARRMDEFVRADPERAYEPDALNS